MIWYLILDVALINCNADLNEVRSIIKTKGNLNIKSVFGECKKISNLKSNSGTHFSSRSLSILFNYTCNLKSW